MIISASRRTDLPAYHSDWFMEQVRAGSCDVPNPVNPKQVSTISLRPEDVEAFVFWTRNPSPFIPHLDELDRRGYHYVFLYTLMDNPAILDPAMGPLPERLATFKALSGRIGATRVSWRYDPIILSNLSPPEFHIETFEKIAGELDGATTRGIISFLDLYRKVQRRLDPLAARGCRVREAEDDDFASILPEMVKSAEKHHMSIQTCAEERHLSPYGVFAGKCIDAKYLSLKPRAKDSGQRSACGCVKSRDIGQYGTCRAGCVYCYAS